MSSKRPTLLIVDDNAEYLDSLARVLRREFSIITATTVEEAQAGLKRAPQLILLDVRLKDDDPANKDGLELLKLIKGEMPEVPVVMMTAYGDIDIAVEAMKLGATDFIQKGKVNLSEFRKSIENALERSRLERKVAQLEEELQRIQPWELVGDDPKILEVKKQIQAVAQDSHVTVLVRGATGTGKELVARAIHSRGPRSRAPFVVVAVSSLARGIIESELFGHEKGAFTGADKRRIGYIEKADGGVLFLDEIGDLDKDVQVKLLRFLENKTFCRLGGTEEITVDVQLVAATNRDLEAAVRSGEFREDLYYRLKVVEIVLPPLIERKGDIPKLASHFLQLLRLQGRTRVERISDEAMKLLIDYPWPGNVRELKYCIERATIFATHNEILPEDLPMEIRNPYSERHILPDVEIPEDGIDIGERLAYLELKYIERALELAGKKTEAWKMLGYNDRFAMRRRVRAILRKYPDIAAAFPKLLEKYKEFSSE